MDPSPNNNSLIRKDTSTSKGCYCMFAALIYY